MLKTSMKILLAAGVLVFAGYMLFPQFRPGIMAMMPFLLLALPMAMCCLMMLGMGKHSSKTKDKPSGREDDE